MDFSNVEDTSVKNDVHQIAPEVPDVAAISALQEGENFDDELGEINPTVIKIIGCGGGGSSAVQRMIEDGVSGVQFIVLNTDKQALHKSTASLRVPIGQKITGGLGAGGNPKVGEDAAKEDSERIAKILAGSNMVVITAGMGGGTGTGSAPVVAELAHNAGILTIAVVTTPFEFEGKIRMDNAMAGLERLRKNVDSLIVLPNDQIFKAVENYERKLTFKEQFKIADGLLCAGVKGITELITKPGEINLDFADLSACMRDCGDSILGVGTGKGENRINEAVEGAIANPLLESRQIDGAKNILLNITTNGNLTLEESREISNLVRHSASKNANIYLGLAINSDMEDDDLSITVVATKFENENEFTDSIAEEEIDVRDETTPVSYGTFEDILGKPREKNSPQKIERPSLIPFATEKNIEPVEEKEALVEEPAVEPAQETEKPTKTVQRTVQPVDLNDKSIPAYQRKNYKKSIDLTQFV